MGIPTIGMFCVYKCRDDHWSSANGHIYHQTEGSPFKLPHSLHAAAIYPIFQMFSA